MLAGGKGGGGMDWDFGISRYKLLHILIEWINNKVLLYSIGNYIQHSVINHNGKEKSKQITSYPKNTGTLLQVTTDYN